MELEMERLQWSMLWEEEFEVNEKALQKQLAEKRALKLQCAQRVADAKRLVDAFHSQYEMRLAEDKVLDKSFRFLPFPVHSN